MEHTFEFGIALISILLISVIIWARFCFREFVQTKEQQAKIGIYSNRLTPTQFNVIRKTDVIDIKDLKASAENKKKVRVRARARVAKENKLQ
jgi:hypothetical protein